MSPDPSWLVRIPDAAPSRLVAKEIWRGLLEGEFCLIGRVERSGQDLAVFSRATEDLGRTRLSPRERQIVEHVARGRSNLWIALELRIHEATVATHLRRALAKLGVRSRLELTLLGGSVGFSEHASEDRGSRLDRPQGRSRSSRPPRRTDGSAPPSTVLRAGLV